jgi:hypothetical protein
MIARSNRPDVRNPLLGFPGLAECFAGLTPEARSALADALSIFAKEARKKAQFNWVKNKGPVALYWKWAGVNARHLSRLLRSAA